MGINLEEVFRKFASPTHLIEFGGVKMDDQWKGSSYTICPKCKQVVSKEDIARGLHFCNFTPKPTLGIWDD